MHDAVGLAAVTGQRDQEHVEPARVQSVDQSRR